MFQIIEEMQATIADLPSAIEATAIAVHGAAKTLEQRRELVVLRACELKTEILMNCSKRPSSG
jgi:hypothetical protein